MKANEIKVGGFYHDNRDGVREVLSIQQLQPNVTTVEYRVLAARVAQEFDSERKEMVSVIGTTASCLLPSFAAWAKSFLTELECQQLLLNMTARKIKLAPGELAFMTSAMDEVSGQLQDGMRIDGAHTEGRAVSGLQKKGLLIRDQKTGEAEITTLGASWAQVYRALV